MSVYTTTNQQIITTQQVLGSGGEGIVYRVKERPQQVAKVYHTSQRTPQREQKLQAMLANPPLDKSMMSGLTPLTLAWPTDILYVQGQFAGFLMPKASQSPDIFKVYHPQLRAKHYPFMDWRHLHRIAKHLASTLALLHQHHYVVGDINQKNILVSTNVLVTLVDTDSFQVKNAQGQMFPCPVGVPEYTPPELQGRSLTNLERTEYHDRFGLAVIIFQLLMQGVHPFTGVPLQPTPSLQGEFYLYCIKKGIFPHQPSAFFSPPPQAPAFNNLALNLQRLFLNCFTRGMNDPLQRPSAAEWAQALTTAEQSLIVCQQSGAHWYSPHVARCPWCQVSVQVRPKVNPPPPVTTTAQPVVTTTPHNPSTPISGWLFAIFIIGIGTWTSVNPMLYFFVQPVKTFLGFFLMNVAASHGLKTAFNMLTGIDLLGLAMLLYQGKPITQATFGFMACYRLAATGVVRVSPYLRRAGQWLKNIALLLVLFVILIGLLVGLLLWLSPDEHIAADMTADNGIAKATHVTSASATPLSATSTNVSEDSIQVAEKIIALLASTQNQALETPKPVMPMVRIKGGSFTMGAAPAECTSDVLKRFAGNLRAGQTKTLTVADFQLGQYEVTVEQFAAFVKETGYQTDAERGQPCAVWKQGQAGAWDKDTQITWRNPSYQQTATHPVVCVSWNDANQYTQWLGRKVGLAYRLPTEAEWEYAARAQTTTVRYWGDDTQLNQACTYANVRDQSHNAQFGTGESFACDDHYPETAPVGQYQNNAYGLYDMLGNVAEWTSSKADNKRHYVFKGGSWGHIPASISAAYQRHFAPTQSGYAIGFRVALNAP